MPRLAPSTALAQSRQASGIDLTDVARRGADMFLKMVFRDGFYHADPHPGNLMVLQDAVIGVLDCGMVGRVNEELREQIEGAGQGRRVPLVAVRRLEHELELVEGAARSALFSTSPSHVTLLRIF